MEGHEIFKSLKRWALFLSRFGVVLFINFLFWPFFLFPLCKAARKIKQPLFGFIFFLYPDRLAHLKTYVPLWYRKLWPGPGIIGFVKKGKLGERGLVVVLPWTIEEMEEKIEILENGIDQVKKLTKAIGVKSVALGGRIVPVLHHQTRMVFNPPFVAGDKGAIFAIYLTMFKAVNAAGLENQVKIGIFGCGFLGSRLANFLGKELGYEVIAIDPRFLQTQNDGRIKLSPNPADISECDLVVVLTPRGEQIEDEIKYLKEGVIVIDDTYPPLTKKAIAEIGKKRGRAVKTAVKLSGIKFTPPFSIWENDWLPGCCIEAIVKARHNNTLIQNQEEFNKLAEQIGFKAL